MICELIEIMGKKFLKVEIVPLIQKNKHFYIAKIPANHFLSLYTVEPAEYDIAKQSILASEFEDDNEYYKFLIDEDEKRIDKKAFQRKEDKKRVKEISDFLNNEEFALFPNSIIATCDLLNDYMDFDEDACFDESIVEKTDENNTLSFLENRNGKKCLFMPYSSESLLVIDGQHRIKGLENSREDIINNYDLLVTFIIEHDRSAIAKLFYTINYTQKSVNKSLLYHLTGEFSYELNEITFMHELVKILNELKSSPFHRRIKMLGDIPKDMEPEEKQLLSISQAFLIDYLKGTISKNAVRSIYQPIFIFYFLNSDYQIEIIRFIIKYFTAISKIKSDDWNNPQSSIICKTISIGAFIKVLHFFYAKLFIDEFDYDPSGIKQINTETLIERFQGLETIDFSNKSEFAGVASGGSLNKLKDKIIENVVFFEGETYQEFLELYKNKYYTPLKQWITDNIK